MLAIIAQRLAKIGLTISPTKSHFCCRWLDFLGYVLSSEGLVVKPERIKAIQSSPTPKTAKGAHRIVGAASWYRRFIPDFAAIVAPINDVYRGNVKGKAKIEWTPETDRAFNQIKEKLQF